MPRPTERERVAVLFWLRAQLGTEEVSQDPRLRALAASLLISVYAVLVFWYRLNSLTDAPTQQLAVVPAWPLGPLAGALPLDHFWLRVYGYHMLMACLLGVFWLWWGRDTLVPLLLLALTWTNELVLYLNDARLASNAIHLQLGLTLLFLLSRRRMDACRAGLVLAFWMLALGQANSSWWSGAIWSTVPGAPLPLSCRLTILAELVLPPLWFFRGRVGALLLTLLLVLWSPVLGLQQAVVLLPFVWLCAQQPACFPDRRASALLLLALLGSLVRFVCPGDSRLTGEGSTTGLGMLDANRQIEAHFEILKGNERFRIRLFVPWADTLPSVQKESGPPQLELSLLRAGEAEQIHLPINGPLVDAGGEVVFNPRLVWRTPWTRALGDPYLYYGYGRQLYASNPPDRLSIRLDEQLDGDPTVYHVLDIADFGALREVDYHGFWHNAWLGPQP